MREAQSIFTLTDGAPLYRSLMRCPQPSRATLPVLSRHPLWLASNTDQCQAQIAQLGDHSIQRGLIDAAGEQHGFIRLMSDRQSVEPGGPAWVEDALDADAVLTTVTAGIPTLFHHHAAPAHRGKLLIPRLAESPVLSVCGDCLGGRARPASCRRWWATEP